MSKELKYCANCVYARMEKSPYDMLKCLNTYVLSNDAGELANVRPKGKDCTEERRQTGWFSVCGIKGKKFEKK